MEELRYDMVSSRSLWNNASETQTVKIVGEMCKMEFRASIMSYNVPFIVRGMNPLGTNILPTQPFSPQHDVIPLAFLKQ